MQGPTISPVFCKRDGRVSADYFAIVICVPKKDLYKSVKQLRAVRLSFQALFYFCYFVELSFIPHGSIVMLCLGRCYHIVG